MIAQLVSQGPNLYVSSYGLVRRREDRPPKQYDQLNTCTAADKKESASIVRRRDEVQWQKAQK
ncbi:uncharacterized protein PHALS_11644 [Plasmopara halstedii]|uniref:Uncharacterized protein n=1 Tax=Plasmopara halstedii TaxID=4781 RepID=A0A0P1AK90_PLAHL|nr:uncharacterized protein PHALS_11644 [Plasmopara halstedii]CEG41287.1 hypothetical protein PHALS_11644 [Plasmopara halstedii]|eukprot:XP_024577656.1 hypothetical protein PHALS_11644 [Plasmopara halstedii]